ncbi:pyridoxamine 5'-phosphate oxidase family protein [Allomuricauda sp. d1]|uniref:pyridoxamine 5'-phosphate oxidase family protein n=1 Tax=Allomuricauda sp. d1 TaxID=3136725 RepID=UPI0031E24290
MEKILFQQLRNELVNGSSKKGHPFRYFTLATNDASKNTRLRTVVLRKVSDDLTLTFYTDRRSVKIKHIEKNNSVSALFYHPKKLLQITMQGTAVVETDMGHIESLWKGIQTKARKDYTTYHAPGSFIKNPDEVEYLTDENHFCVVHVQPSKIEYLRLKRPNHIRAAFEIKHGDWQGNFLVP